MNVTMILSRFGSSMYIFYIEPCIDYFKNLQKLYFYSCFIDHTTEVDYTTKDISCNKHTIYINHNNTGTIHPRLCSGYINQIDAQNKSTHNRVRNLGF